MCVSSAHSPRFRHGRQNRGLWPLEPSGRNEHDAQGFGPLGVAVQAPVKELPVLTSLTDCDWCGRKDNDPIKPIKPEDDASAGRWTAC
jgi:hypothetical protein